MINVCPDSTGDGYGDGWYSSFLLLVGHAICVVGSGSSTVAAADDG